MNTRTRSQVVAHVIVALFITLISTLWLVPAASAQAVTIASSMDNNTPIRPGDTVEAGFQVTAGDAQSGAMTTSVTSAIAHMSVSCPGGGSQTITINFPSQSVSVPAKNSGWYPSNANIYQGKGIAPSNLCGGKEGRANGTVFTATFGEKCDGDREGGCCHPVCFRFHERCNHEGDFSGGSWDDDDHSCKQEKKCISAEKKDDCRCGDKDKEHD